MKPTITSATINRRSPFMTIVIDATDGLLEGGLHHPSEMPDLLRSESSWH